jgi:hypothetical protein
MTMRHQMTPCMPFFEAVELILSMIVCQKHAYYCVVVPLDADLVTLAVS